MSALAKVATFGRSVAGGVRHAPFVHSVAVLTVAIALFSVGLVRSALGAVEGLLGTLGGEVQVTVYLAPGSSEAQVAAVRERLEARSGGTATWVSPASALERLAGELGDLGQALQALPDNPLPPSLELTVPPGARTPGALRALAAEVRALEGVEGVDYGQEAVERLEALARALRRGGLVGLAVVLLATAVIVSATLQLAIYARRDEIEIQKLVGATDRFVKAPFLLEGILQGLLGAALALAALLAVGRWGLPALLPHLAFLTGPPQALPALPSARLALELVAGGCALGFCGSLIAVGRFLRA